VRLAGQWIAGRLLHRHDSESRPHIGITESTVLAWNVFSPIAEPGRGDIAGTYVGIDAMAAAVIGVGNVLLGGSNNSIALQPLSVQGETGIIVAAGLERLDLQPGR
jgi:hypothetical protein